MNNKYKIDDNKTPRLMKCCCDNGGVSFVLYFQILYKLKSFLSNMLYML